MKLNDKARIELIDIDSNESKGICELSVERIGSDYYIGDGLGLFIKIPGQNPVLESIKGYENMNIESFAFNYLERIINRKYRLVVLK